MMIIKRIFCLVLCFIIFSFSCYAVEIPKTYAHSYVLMREDNKEVILSDNADEKMPMASTTKIMTALVVVENTSLDNIVTIGKSACNIEGSSCYLCEGEKLSVKDLLYALMLQSANDSAVALAEYVGGSLESFVQMMNDKAKELGLKNTHYDNPNGLDSDTHYSSANDLAVLMQYAMKNKTFAQITHTYKYTASKTNKGVDRVFVNHNKLLRTTKYCVGGKTGFTKRCGRCLVSVARQSGVGLICVTLKDGNDWNDHINLYNYGFDLLECVNYDSTEYNIPLIASKDKTLFAYTKPIGIVKLKAQDINLETKLKRFYYAPIKKGEVVGQVSYYIDNKKVAQSDIVSKNKYTPIKYKNFFEKLLDKIKD